MPSSRVSRVELSAAEVAVAGRSGTTSSRTIRPERRRDAERVIGRDPDEPGAKGPLVADGPAASRRRSAASRRRRPRHPPDRGGSGRRRPGARARTPRAGRPASLVAAFAGPRRSSACLGFPDRGRGVRLASKGRCARWRRRASRMAAMSSSHGDGLRPAAAWRARRSTGPAPRVGAADVGVLGDRILAVGDLVGGR